ncbi:kinase-like domain-containing protein [Irpex rosettiformis]|uniref:Kinase-like domain-containing protein n=1 Tax=Irpex rosettiformis TaxID=378272 RepID=A0ACB8UKA8_9APHY|nr:kinase-like domain-containing protein [Irpex rosettiformis]
MQQTHGPHTHQNGYTTTNYIQNTHHQPPPQVIPQNTDSQPPHPSSHRNAPPQHQHKESVTVIGIPSVTIQDGELAVGDAQSSSTRSYTPLKVVGDGSFGTVWLCDWHGTLPPNTPLSAMQCGAGARPEYAGRRLVAVKRMKRRWEGGWDECKRLKELESLRAIPYHPNIIPLYDFFLLPATKELYFVFESMEGNLYQLIKTRKGKPLAGGLVSSIFSQVVQGLHHIHSSGYFHRDMKPENLLVTTTGLYDYRSVARDAPPDAPSERDVVVIIKLADFGLARETNSSPPYTEYVSTRWYRAPEVLLKSRNYSNPVDMWALGTIMAELVNLRPLFPGQSEIDQVARICEVLGDPVEDYGLDSRGKPVGGGKWPQGVRMARNVGFAFQPMQPRNIYDMFDRNVPLKLIDCIVDLLKYNPDIRLSSLDCLQHPYLLETAPRNSPPGPPTLPVARNPAAEASRAQARTGNVGHGVNGSNTSLPSIAPRNVPPSHSHPDGIPKMHPPIVHIPPHPALPEVTSSHRSSFYDSGFASVHSRTRSVSTSQTSEYSSDLYSPRSSDIAHHEAQRAPFGPGARYPEDRVQGWAQQQARLQQQQGWDPMDVMPQVEMPNQTAYVTAQHHPMDIQQSPMAREYPSRPPIEQEPPQDTATSQGPPQNNKFPKLFGKKHSKWGLGMFGHGDKHQNSLPPVQENGVANHVQSLKRRDSGSTDSRSMSELDVSRAQQIEDPKQRKKEQERAAKEIQREAERQRRARVEKMQREQARQVMKNRGRLAQNNPQQEIEWLSGPQIAALPAIDKGKQPAATGPIRQAQSHGASSMTVNAAGGSFKGASASPVVPSPKDVSFARANEWHRENGRLAKARRRDFDDDHSMSSDRHTGRASVISFATIDSDPGPAGRASHSGHFVGRMQSMNSLRSNPDGFTTSTGQSPASTSMEQQLVNDFHLRASVDSASISDGGSPQPLPMHMLTLSSPKPWARSRSDMSSSTTVDHTRTDDRLSSPSVVSPQPRPHYQLGPSSPYDTISTGGVYGPPSPGLAPKSAINPIFKVSSYPSTLDRPALSLSSTSLPPFSQLEAVADGEYPPLSPMSFTIPEEEIAGEDSDALFQ